MPPQPIAPVGKVQVFANPQCTEYADGQSDTVYVRLNQDFGFGDITYWGTTLDEPETYLVINTPENEDPTFPYCILCWADYRSNDYNEPFTNGQVVECVYLPPSFYPIDNPQVIFE